MRLGSRAILCAAFALAAGGGVASASFGGPLQYELQDYNPTPDPSAVVSAGGGHARFTVLTDRVIRMQYLNSTGQGSAELDAATLAVVNRRLPVPHYTVNASGSGGVTITTSSVKLVYKGGPFAPATLTVTSVDDASAFKTWSAGQTSATDAGSLLGTFRTLDGTAAVSLNCTVDKKQHCVWGVLSRTGWALVDDTPNAILEDQHDWPFDGAGQLFPRPEVADWYLFAHGHDYRGALGDFGKVSGAVAMPPRASLGVWYTRWFDYANIDVRGLVDGYSSRNYPLDVLVLDMNWHSKNAWGGYTFDSNLHPVPEDLGDFARNASGLLTLVNLHDAGGVGAWEAQYSEYCKAIGADCSDGKGLPANFTSRQAMLALEDVVWKPVQEQFSDHAWIDWQQGEHGGGMPGGMANPTIQLNKVRNTDPKRRAAGAAGPYKRGMQLGRFGGYGNQRYPVGFSGDVAGLTWSNLAYQPYFTMTASNAGGFSYWSHDITGPGGDHEMYTRWITWGSLSPMMRSHERGMSAGGCKDPFPDRDEGEDRCAVVMPWNIPMQYREANRRTLQRRAELVPYLYTAAREAFDTQVGLMRPLYYDWPEEESAYGADVAGTLTAYMLGPSLLVSPVTAASGPSSLATKTTWLPPGTWVEVETHRVLAGGRNFTRDYDIDQTPIFARAGAVVPLRTLAAGDMQATARRAYDALTFAVFPGADSGSGLAYEDDGETTAYLAGEFAWHTLSYSWAPDRSLLTLKYSVNGSFAGAPASRRVTVNVVNAPPADGAASFSSGAGSSGTLPFARWGGPGTWSWDGSETALTLSLPSMAAKDLQSGVTVTVPFSAATVAAAKALGDGAKGLMANARKAKAALDRTRQTPGAHVVDPAYVSRLTSQADGLAYWAGRDAAKWAAVVSNTTALGAATAAELKSLVPPPPPPPGALVQLYDESRKDSLLCGTTDCITGNGAYTQVRIEGFQPPQGTGVVKLNDYWDQDTTDNFATTATTAPSGYSPAVFSNGFVYAAQEEGSVPLFCFFNADKADHVAVATQAGIDQAKKEGYTACTDSPGAVLGYVLTKPTLGPSLAPRETAVGAINAERIAYGIDLMASASTA